MNASTESPNLDFLRSAAVLFVLNFHVLLLFEKRHSPYVSRLRFFHSVGHWGVLIFFVHTSLVLMFSLERQFVRSEGRPTYLPFIIRRVFRIFPLSICIVLLVTILNLPVAYLTGGQFEAAHLHRMGIAANLLLVQNLTRTDSVIIPLWSLPYEMQMYLFLPALFLFAWWTRRVWPILLLWAMAVFMGRHAAGLEKLGFPDFIIYVPCFLSGVLAYQLTKSWRLKLPALLFPVVLAALTVLFLRDPSYQNAWYSCLLLGVAIPQFKEMTNSAVRGVVHIIARYSYGIYLIHFICIWLAFQAIGGIPDWSRWIILTVTVIVFPYVLYHRVEEPMIRMGQKVSVSVQNWLENPAPTVA
jgi:peptidoglycan/LPS O-acetylase OafA/YrhL